MLGALSLGGCVSMAGYERGTVVPVAELMRHRADPSALAEAELAAGHAGRGFHALEVARTMRFVGEQLVRDERRRADGAAAREITLGGALEISAPADATSCHERAEGICLRAGPELRVRGGAEGPAARQLAEQRAAREARSSERFWRDYALIERRLAAFGDSSNVRSYRSIFYDRFVVPSAENARLALGPGQAYVAFLVRDKVWAIVTTRRASRAIGLELTPDELGRLSAKLSTTLLCPTYARGPRLRHCGGKWQQAWRKPAAALHAAVWAPIAEAVGDARSIFVAPDGALVHIPVGVLLDGEGKMLLAKHRLTYLPSLAVYLTALNRRRKQGPPSMLAVGDPLHSKAGTVRLPMAALEAETVGGIFDGSAALVDTAAAETDVKAAIARHNILHFATHGLASRDDPLLSSLLLGDGGGDGLLTAEEIRGLDLGHLHVAVLSACETAVVADERGGAGAGDVAKGALDSLVGSFLVAGAPAVVGSFWSVSDASTTKLMLRFYAAFLEVGVSEALRLAQLSMAGDARFGHPYYWSAFSPWGIDG